MIQYRFLICRLRFRIQ